MACWVAWLFEENNSCKCKKYDFVIGLNQCTFMYKLPDSKMKFFEMQLFYLEETSNTKEFSSNRQ